MEAKRTSRLRRALARALVALAVVETGWLLYPAVRARLLALEETPARRGQRLAGELGVLLVPRTGGWRRHEEPGQRGRDRARGHGAHADDVREDDRRSPR